MDDPFCLDYNTVHKIEKPPLPYIPGHELSVARHYPSPPPPKWHGIALKYEVAREREHADILTRCLRHPPTEGRFGGETLHLKITDTIRARDGQCSQLVTVRVLNHGLKLSGREIVAKLYGPLYFNHYQDDFEPFLCADREYRRESAAYDRLSGIANIPEYYGSFSLELSVDQDRSRFVRLVLIQKVSGIPMNELNPSDSIMFQRQTIMKKIIDTESRLYQRDVNHFDMHPRNIIVRANESDPNEVGITVIDFGHAIIGRSYDPEGEPEEEAKMLPGQYISPIVRWAVPCESNAMPVSFKCWINWDWNSWLKKQYKDDEVTDHMRSEWMPEDTTTPWPLDCGEESTCNSRKAKPIVISG